MPTMRMQDPAEPKAVSTVPNGMGMAAPANLNLVVPDLGSILSVRREIDDVMQDMGEFHRAEPDNVMAAVSAHGARLTEIIVRIQRIEVVRREWKPVREEAEKVLTELKSQFSIASRLIAIRQMDFDLSRGGT